MLRLRLCFLFLMLFLSSLSFAEGGFNLVLRSKPVIESERIRLRAFDMERDSTFAMEQILSAPDVAQFYLMHPYHPANAITASQRSSRGVWSDGHTYFRNWPTRRVNFVIEDRASGRIVGLFDLTELHGWNRFEIGRAIHPNYRRHGYASESLSLVVDWVRSMSPDAKIVSWTRPDNEVGNRMRTKDGFRYERTIGEMCEYLLTR